MNDVGWLDFFSFALCCKAVSMNTACSDTFAELWLTLRPPPPEEGL